MLLCCCRWRDDGGADELLWQAVPDKNKNKAGLYRLARGSYQAQRDCARAGRGQVTLQEASRESGHRVRLGHIAAILWLDDNWGECKAIFIVTLIFASCIFPRSWLDYFLAAEHNACILAPQNFVLNVMEAQFGDDISRCFYALTHFRFRLCPQCR